MQNQEHLLSNYPLIYNLLNVGLTIKQIAQEVNRLSEAHVSYRQLRYLIKRVQTKAIHKEYDKMVMIDSANATRDTKLSKYCIEFHDLLITYKSAANLTDPKYIITPDNLTTIYSKEALLYAKRILKLYHMPDISLLKKHQLIYPHQPDIDLQELTHKINTYFNDEFNTMLLNLRQRYVHFLINNLKELTHAN